MNQVVVDYKMNYQILKLKINSIKKFCGKDYSANENKKTKSLLDGRSSQSLTALNSATRH